MSFVGCGLCSLGWDAKPDVFAAADLRKKCPFWSPQKGPLIETLSFLEKRMLFLVEICDINNSRGLDGLVFFCIVFDFQEKFSARSGLLCQRTPPMHCNMPLNHASRKKRFLPRPPGFCLVKRCWEVLGRGWWSTKGWVIPLPGKGDNPVAVACLKRFFVRDVDTVPKSGVRSIWYDEKLPHLHCSWSQHQQVLRKNKLIRSTLAPGNQVGPWLKYCFQKIAFHLGATLSLNPDIYVHSKSFWYFCMKLCGCVCFNKKMTSEKSSLHLRI